MSNVVTGNPLVVDTTSASTLIASRVLEPTVVRWVGATTAGHTCILADAAGNVKWSSVATAANFLDQTYFPPEFTMAGLIPAVGSGVCYIYHAGPVPI